MSMMTVAAVGGLALSGYGAYSSHQQAGAQQRAQNQALASARTSLNGFTNTGLGGIGSTYWNNPNGQGGMMQLQGGELDPIRAALTGYARNQVPTGQGGLPPQILAALQGVQGASGMQGINFGLPGMNDAGLRTIEQANSRTGGMAMSDMSRLFGGGFQQGLQNTAFRGAANQLRDASMGGEQARARTLDLLRQEAAPHEGRAFNSLQDRLFASGRMGSTGGGIQMEAFARGLGQADLSRQLAASEEGRSFQNNAMGLSQGMAGMGSGLASQSDQLLNSAFGRFQQTQQLGADLNRERFDRSAYANQLGFDRSVFANQLGYDRSRDMLGMQTNMAMLPGQMDALRLGNMGMALQGQSGIQDQVLQMFNAGLGAEQAAANARIGSASNMANIVGSPNFGLGGQMQASTWSQLGSSLMGGQSAGDILGRMFRPTASNTGSMGPAGSGVLANQPAYGSQPYPQWGWGG